MNARHSLPYRPDIDGLRAVAVLLVVGFHAFPHTVAGGFIGVDIFFVISGYLIGGILLTDLHEGTFSPRRFYKRRILRIFPALLVVLAACLMAGWLTLLPDEFKALGKQVFGGSTFISNFLLWREAVYFDSAARAKPLLHLWSLGIEEQFYLVLPLVLWFCHRRRLRAAVVVGFLGLLSFWDNMYLYRIDPTADFYSPLLRFWELLAGALLMALSREPRMQNLRRQLDNVCERILYCRTTDDRPDHNGHSVAGDGSSLGLILAALGFCLLGAGLVTTSQDDAFPGYKALFPVLGALSLVAAGTNNLLSHVFLANKIAIFIGKISYPLYLWHWPLLSFAFLLHGDLNVETRILRLFLVGMAFVLAVLTYFFVEKPLRFGSAFGKTKIPFLLFCMLLLSALGSFVRLADGFPERAKFRHRQAILDALQRPPSIDDDGLSYTGFERGDVTYCRYTNTGSSVTVAVVGDSHAGSAYPGIAALGKAYGYNTVLLGRYHPGLEKWDPNLKHQPDRILKFLSSKQDISKVIIVTRGILYLQGIHNQGERRDAKDRRHSASGKEKCKADLQNFVGQLQKMKKEVAIVAENPELNVDARELFSRGLTHFTIKSEYPRTLKTETLERQKPYLDILNEFRKLPGVTVLDAIDAFCPREECLVLNDEGLPLYYDDDHLSEIGSAFQAQKILRPWLMRTPESPR